MGMTVSIYFTTDWELLSVAILMNSAKFNFYFLLTTGRKALCQSAFNIHYFPHCKKPFQILISFPRLFQETLKNGITSWINSPELHMRVEYSNKRELVPNKASVLATCFLGSDSEGKLRSKVLAWPNPKFGSFWGSGTFSITRSGGSHLAQAPSRRVPSYGNQDVGKQGRQKNAFLVLLSRMLRSSWNAFPYWERTEHFY